MRRVPPYLAASGRRGKKLRRVEATVGVEDGANPLHSREINLVEQQADVGLFLEPDTVLAAVLAASLMRIHLGWRLQKRLGGYTGDRLGAVQQLCELAFYLGLLVVI